MGQYSGVYTARQQMQALAAGTWTRGLDGSSAAAAAPSAAAIKTLTGTNTDGVYWIDLPTVGPTQIYCIMNSAVGGGGWMMAMKATRGTTFPYSSSYWTTTNTLNASTGLNRNDGDAKFDSFNYFPATDMLAIWPDLSNGGDITGLTQGTIWRESNFNSGTAVTLRNWFNTVAGSNKAPASGRIRGTQWNGGSQFSSQSGNQFYGWNYTANGSWGVRWGFAWNNENDWGSNDVGGGIGMAIGSYSAGDYIGCCQDVTGFNRTARVEMYVR